MFVTEDIRYIGVNDHDVDLFEGQYTVENGMSYNSYVILDEKGAVMDTVDANFTHEQLKKAYSLKSKLLYVDFGNKKEDTIRREQDSYDYQILIMYEYLRKMFKDIDLEKKGLFNISKSAKEFYEKEINHAMVSQLFDFISLDIKNLDMEIETAKTTMDLEKAFSEFIQRKNESYQMFINNIMYGNNEKDHHETINGESLVQIVSMKELIITVYTILIDRDYMLNNIKTKVEEQFKPGSAEYNLGAKYYIRMKLAKTYEEAKGIYNDALVQLSSLDTIEENKKTSSR